MFVTLCVLIKRQEIIQKLLQILFNFVFFLVHLYENKIHSSEMEFMLVSFYVSEQQFFLSISRK